MIAKINISLQSKFTLLLVSLIFYILLLPYVGDTLITKFILLFITLFVFIAVMFAIPQQRTYLVTFVVAIIVAFIMNCLYVFIQSDILAILNALSFAIFCLIAIYCFTNDIMHHKVITTDLVMGSLCVYFLIGIVYAYIYAIIEVIHPGSFAIAQSQQTPNNFELLYFSYITLTTLGYGDIISSSVYSKSFVILESVTGVFYIATLVARLVSAVGRQKS